MFVVSCTPTILLVLHTVTISAIFLRQRQDEVARKPKIIVTPSHLQFARFQSFTVSCHFRGSAAWYWQMVVRTDLNKNGDFYGGKTVCRDKKRMCQLTVEKFDKQAAVWYACVAYYRNDLNVFVPKKGGTYTLNTKGLLSAGKQFRLDMKPHESLTNLRVRIQTEKDTPIYYDLPQTTIPLIEVFSNKSLLYNFSCSTDGNMKNLDRVSLTWKFLPDVTHVKTISDHKYNRMAPTTQLKNNENGIYVDTPSVRQSNFRIAQPSIAANGVYYCEWMTSTTVQRSPAFELRVKLAHDNTCTKSVVWKNICHSKARCFQHRYYADCKCLPGLRGNGINCEDIDECETDLAECPEHSKCKNTYGMYTCACAKGYKYDRNSRSCIVDFNSINREDDDSEEFNFLSDDVDTANAAETKQHVSTEKTVKKDPKPTKSLIGTKKTSKTVTEANQRTSSQSDTIYSNQQKEQRQSLNPSEALGATKKASKTATEANQQTSSRSDTIYSNRDQQKEQQQSLNPVEALGATKKASKTATETNQKTASQSNSIYSNRYQQQEHKHANTSSSMFRDNSYRVDDVNAADYHISSHHVTEDEQRANDSKESLIAVIGGSVAGIVVTGIIIGVVVYFVKRRRSATRQTRTSSLQVQQVSKTSRRAQRKRKGTSKEELRPLCAQPASTS